MSKTRVIGLSEGKYRQIDKYRYRNVEIQTAVLASRRSSGRRHVNTDADPITAGPDYGRRFDMLAVT